MASDAKVLIVGGGLGGLFLGIALERAKIDYLILERATTVKPLGSALSFGSGITPAFQQLGLYDRLMAISKKVVRTNIMREDDLKVFSTQEFTEEFKRYGYPAFILPRPSLYALLLENVPQHKIMYGKRVLSLSQGENNVTVRCSDGSTFSADCLVGADGAYSATRQSLFKQLETLNLLPKSDASPLVLTAAMLLGTTNSLDPTQYPQVLDEGRMDVVLGNGDYNCVYFTIPGHRICWTAGKFLDPDTEGESLAFKSSEWGDESTAETIAEVSGIKMPGLPGATMKEVIDQTDPALISKVAQEEKLFKTWFHGRVVLIGDAAHKMTPAAGQGATSAFMDAISLANHLNDMTSNTSADYTAAFTAYKNERFEIAKLAVDASANSSKILGSKTRVSGWIRSILFNLPQWARNLLNDNLRKHKPQFTFLPFVEDLGVVKSPPQKQSTRMATGTPARANAATPTISVAV